MGGWTDGWEVIEGQHINSVDQYVTSIKCTNKSIDKPCTLGPSETWRNLLNSERIFLVRGEDRGRRAWHYVLVVDDEETLQIFKEKTQGENAGKHTVNVADYGQVLKSGWGEKPPNDVKEWMMENYGAS